ncbi:MAG: dipeptidase PepE [Alistipes sp.]|nr:dipeptidase PepE [Alistipes sp.]
MRLLLISNSTNAGEAFLAYPQRELASFLAGVSEVLFIPYAAVTFSYEEYLLKVQARFRALHITVRSVHRESNPAQAVRQAQAVVVGGGNTFALLGRMQQEGLIAAIRERVEEGMPYVGWSAGSNVACPTIGTTNDMPIVEPASFFALRLIPFQINPHYTDEVLQGHAGETREQRILEYIEANPSMYVVGLREGSILRLEGDALSLIGSRPMRVFRQGESPRELSSGEDLSFLLR